MGKLLKVIIALVILSAVGIGAVYWYVQPTRPLDLAYCELSVRNKLAELVTGLKPEMELSEPEVNSLLKKALAAHPPQQKDVEITGAEFTLLGNRLIADVNLLYKKRWKAGATLHFTLSWNEPYLTAVHTATYIRQAQLPLEWFRMQPIQLPLNDFLPKPAGVRNVTFMEHAVKLQLKLR